MTKHITKTLKSIGFSIEISNNLKSIDFLDVTLNLKKIHITHKKKLTIAYYTLTPHETPTPN